MNMCVDIKDLINACVEVHAAMKRRKEAKEGTTVIPESEAVQQIALHPLFDTIFVHYLMLNALVTRLFAVFDRCVYVFLCYPTHPSTPLFLTL